jgi:hypothetical protein
MNYIFDAKSMTRTKIGILLFEYSPRVNIRAWPDGKRHVMPFAVPMIRREAKDRISATAFD